MDFITRILCVRQFYFPDINVKFTKGKVYTSVFGTVATDTGTRILIIYNGRIIPYYKQYFRFISNKKKNKEWILKRR